MSLGLDHRRCLIIAVFVSIFMLIFLYGFNFHHTSHQSRYYKPQHRNLLVTRTKNTTVKNIRMLPNALIIGVRKGGTRALIRALSIHPDIHSASKEVHFFDRDDNYAKGIEWYRSLFPEVAAMPGQIVIEKSPSYYVTPSVPQRIYKMSKSVKLLVVVRNPTRRAISDYSQIKAKNPKLPPFERYVTTNDKETALKINDNCIDIGLYSKHLRRWLLYFPLNQIHFVNGEELSTNPFPELKAVEMFLNLKPSIQESDFVFNKTKGFPCFRKTKHRQESTTFTCLGATKGRQHPPVRQDILDLLDNYYKPHNKQFYRMVHRDFGWNRE